MKVTLKDIAKKAGVAKSTVSFVLNNNPRVSDETRQKVLQTIRELNYRPNEIAVRLGRGKSGNSKSRTLAIISGTFDAQDEAYFSNILCGATKEAGKRDFKSIYKQITKDDFHNFAAMCHTVDGIIFTYDPDERIVKHAEKNGIPFVLADSSLQGYESHRISPDNRHGIFEVIDYLYRLGHRKIAFISGHPPHPDSIEKLASFRERMNEYSLDHSNVREGTYSTAYGEQAFAELYAENKTVTALICGNDYIAMGVYQQARKMGLRIPQDLSVTGYDGLPLIDHVTPKLTSVKVDIEAIGREACRLLIDLINKRCSCASIKVCTELRIGGSCSAPRNG